MLELNQLLLITHIAAGVMALLMFWVPAFAKKGGLNHKKFGRHYTRAMNIALISGMVLAVWAIAMPQTLKPQYFTGDLSAARIGEIEWQLRMFWAFILFLGMFTLLTVRHANKVLNVTSHEQFKTPSYLLPIIGVLVSGAGIITLGVLYNKVLFMIFGGIGISVAVGQLRFCLQKASTVHTRLLEHISSMVGSGIGAHTAFLTFGGRQLLNLEGYWQLALWILPGVVGTFAIMWLTKKYSQPHNKKV